MTIMSRAGAERWWKMEVPPDVKYYFHDGHQLWNDMKPKWQAHTWTMEHALRTDKQNSNTWRKRKSTQEVKPCYVWVFYNDPDNFPFFTGWYVYIKTLNDDYALNFRTHKKELISKIMELYPCGLFTDFQLWAPSFAQQFRHAGFKRKNNQGIAKAWCQFNESGNITNIFI